MNSRSLLIGTYEIKQPYQRNLALGFGISGMIHVTAVISILLFISMKPAPAIHINPTSLAPITHFMPPVIGIKPPPHTNLTPPKIVPKFGILIPIADSLASPDSSILTQIDLIGLAPETPINNLDGNTIVNTAKVIDSLLLPRGTFTPFDDPPVAVNSVKPVYPDLARRTGLESTVWLELLIDRDGKVRDVSVVKCSNKNMGFEDAALAAAWKSVWKPAISNGLPIAVRVTFAVVFKLQ